MAASVCGSTLLSSVTTCRFPRTASRRTACARKAARSIRCAADGSTTRDARELLPQSSGHERSELVATVAASPTAAAPVSEAGQFQQWCRANWKVLLLAQTGALVGAAYSGISSRNKRLEISKLNDKLRTMKEKVDNAGCAFEWTVDDEEEADWPGSKELSDAAAALEAGNIDAALAAFSAAKAAVVEYAGEGYASMAAASWLSAGKGTALALMRAGDKESLRLAAVELKGVASIAEAEADGSVYGLLGDVLTDLGEYTEAGRYYDKCIALD